MCVLTPSQQLQRFESVHFLCEDWQMMAGRMVQVLTMNNFKWYDFLRSCPRLFAGTHTELKGVTTLRCEL